MVERNAMTDTMSLMQIAATITVLGGAYLTIRKIARDAEKSKEHQAAVILQSAKEEDSLIKAKLEARIELVRVELANIKLNVDKDLNHFKESHEMEIEMLGKKVEEIRAEFRSSHSQLVELLTKIVNRRD